MSNINPPDNRNKLAWLVLLGFFVLFVGLLTLAETALKQSNLQTEADKPVTEQQLSAALVTHPQKQFKRCVASVLSEKAGLVNRDLYKCELKVNRKQH